MRPTPWCWNRPVMQSLGGPALNGPCHCLWVDRSSTKLWSDLLNGCHRRALYLSALYYILYILYILSLSHQFLFLSPHFLSLSSLPLSLSSLLTSFFSLLSPHFLFLSSSLPLSFSLHFLFLSPLPSLLLSLSSPFTSSFSLLLTSSFSSRHFLSLSPLTTSSSSLYKQLVHVFVCMRSGMGSKGGQQVLQHPLVAML